ncbi:hypothetical protein [Thermocrispum municipale]|uniref:hypothetical protein n=1 Tax=Thermocrispum municipale TaxID=37926 RepID=UPI000419576B|nr:hypothetical protein [Thermocrispum municipale]
MLIAIILLLVLAAAYWREALKLAVGALVVVLLLGLVQLAEIVDRAGDRFHEETISSLR